MNIEIFAENFKTNNTTINYIHEFFNKICEIINLDDQFINKIIFADIKFYGQKIKEIDINENFTNNENYKGVAKTICKYENDQIINYIIFKIEFLIFFIKIANNEIDYKDLNNRFYFFTFYHELGHCKDNLDRKFLENIKFPFDDFKVKKILNYYYKILLGEIAANSFVSFYYDDELILKEINDFICNDFNKLLKNLENLKNNYYIDKNLYNIIVGYWVIFLMY